MPENTIVSGRLEKIRQQLLAGYGGGSEMSSATRGREREDFVSQLLEKCLPPQYRFGTGDITDISGASTGQLDLVVEFPHLPSFPMIGASPRLYLAEGAAAVVEVKSNIAKQWEDVESTATRVKALTRKAQTAGFGISNPKIPVFAVGYTGWQTVEPMFERVLKGLVDGILVLDAGGVGAFAVRLSVLGLRETEQHTVMAAGGPRSLLCLLQALHMATRQVLLPGATPFDYGFDVVVE